MSSPWRIPSCCDKLDARSRALAAVHDDLALVTQRLLDDPTDPSGAMDMLDYIRSAIRAELGEPARNN